MHAHTHNFENNVDWVYFGKLFWESKHLQLYCFYKQTYSKFSTLNLEMDFSAPTCVKTKTCHCMQGKNSKKKKKINKYQLINPKFEYGYTHTFPL